MKAPVKVLMADVKLHGASLHLPLLEVGWQRPTGVGQQNSYHGTSNHGAFTRLFPSKEFEVLGMCPEGKLWRKAASWGWPGGHTCPAVSCPSWEQWRDFPKLPRSLSDKAGPDVRVLTLGLTRLGISQLFERADVLRTRLGVSVQALEQREEGGKTETMSSALRW